MVVAVVTDSTAYLPARLLEQYAVEVVPLYVVMAGHSGREGEDIGPADVARALGARGQRVSTSRPTPGDFVAAYRRRLAAGAERIVSVHLSAELSGTVDAARLAAAQVGEHVVTVVDSRSAAMGNGFAVLAAAPAAARGGGTGAAAPTARALVRLVQRGVEAAAGRPVMVAVHHLAAPERAEKLAADLEERLPGLRELYVSELGAAIGAHVGPGAVGLVVAPAGAPPVPTQQDRPQEAEDR